MIVACRKTFWMASAGRPPSLLAQADYKKLKANLRAANTLIVLYLSFAGMMGHDRTQFYILRGGTTRTGQLRISAMEVFKLEMNHNTSYNTRAAL